MHGTVLVLDPEYGKLEPGRRYLSNGFGLANHATDAVDIAVVELGEGLLVLQELFLIEAYHHRGGEAKHILIPKDKVRLCVCVAGHWDCGVGLRCQGVDKGRCRLLIDGSSRVVVAVVVSLLSGA